MSVCSISGASDAGLVKCAIECCLAVHGHGEGSGEAEGEDGRGWGEGGDASITMLHGLCKVMGNPDWVGMASPLTAEELASIFGCIVDLSRPLPNKGAAPNTFHPILETTEPPKSPNPQTRDRVSRLWRGWAGAKLDVLRQLIFGCFVLSACGCGEGRNSPSPFTKP